MYWRAEPVDNEQIVTKEATVLSNLKEQLHDIYVGIDLKTTSDKQLIIQFVGDEEYFYSVKSDLEIVINKGMKNPALKDYTVVFQRWEFANKMEIEWMHKLP